MATPVGSIYINLGARTAELKKGLENSQAQIKSLSTSVKKYAATAKKAFALVGAAAVAASYALVSIIDTQRQNIQEMAKFSKLTGVGIKQLQILSLAAERAGIANETLYDALKELGIRLSEVRQGTGQAVEGLQLLGFSGRRLASMSLDNAILEIAKALQELDKFDQIFVLDAMFGEAGVQLAQLFADGGKNIKEAFQAISSIGFIDEKDIKKVEMLNKTVAELQAQITQLSKILTSELSDEITAFLKLLQNAIEKNKKAAEQLISILEGFSSFIILIYELWNVVQLVFRVIFMGIRSILHQVLRLQRFVGNLAKGIKNLFESVTGIDTGAFGKFVDKYSEFLNLSADQSYRGMENLSQKIKEDFLVVTGETRNTFEELLKEFKMLLATSKKTEKGIFNFAKIIKTIRTEAAKLIKENLVKNLKETQEELERNREKIKQIFEELQEDIDSFDKSKEKTKFDQLKELGATKDELFAYTLMQDKLEQMTKEREKQKKLEQEKAKLLNEQLDNEKALLDNFRKARSNLQDEQRARQDNFQFRFAEAISVGSASSVRGRFRREAEDRFAKERARKEEEQLRLLNLEIDTQKQILDELKKQTEEAGTADFY